jgi:hypothetical protein
MTSALYALFPDAREPEDSLRSVSRLERKRNVTGAQYHPPFSRMVFTSPIEAWHSHGVMEPDEMLDLLKQVDWAYPALLAYRTSEDNRWSHMLLGMSVKPELGDD